MSNNGVVLLQHSVNRFKRQLKTVLFAQAFLAF